VNELNVGPGYREGVFSAISAGFFFILIGAIFVITPNLLDKIIEFLRGFDIVRVPNMDIFIPAPAHPKDHSVVYSAVTLFSFVWGLFQILILALRFVFRSPLDKKAETVSNLVFWLGTGFLTSTFLNETITRTTWFVFWTGIIMLIGVSLVIRAFILAIRMYTLD
jgi:hypothetical protein